MYYELELQTFALGLVKYRTWCQKTILIIDNLFTLILNTKQKGISLRDQETRKETEDEKGSDINGNTGRPPSPHTSSPSEGAVSQSDKRQI